MPNSLRAKLKKLNYDGKISENELNDLLSKLYGHDKEIKRQYSLLSNDDVEKLEMLKAEIEWDFSIEYQIILDKIIEENETSYRYAYDKGVEDCIEYFFGHIDEMLENKDKENCKMLKKRFDNRTRNT